MARIIHNTSDILGLLNRGKFLARLNEELQEALATLEGQPNNKGKAEISMTLKLSFDDGRLGIEPKFKTKLPDEPGFSETTFWLVDGGLSVQHPSQMDMYPEDVDVRAERRERQTTA